DTQTIEMGFVRAVQTESFERARSLAERATAQNLDFVNGLSYQARLADAEGRSEEAASLLQQAAALGTGDAAIHRLLGMSLRKLGRTDAAVRAFEEALSIRPDEVQTTTEYVSTLAEAGRFEAALDVARRQQRFALTNPAFVRLWLSLEAVAGGAEGRTLAITQREQLLEANPSDAQNRYALAGLYIEDQNWDAAKTLIDGLIAEEGSLRATEALASWYANQGRVGTQDGLLLASQAYQRYVRGLGDDVTSEPFISLARFMVARGRQDLAVRAADQAIEREDPSTLEGTKLKGELLMSIGQSSGAADEFRKVVDAGVDEEDGRYRLRLVEMYLRMREYGAAEEAMAGLPAASRDTLTNYLQRAEIAKGLADTEGERRILDEAASKFPDESLVYVKRAQSMLGDPSLLPDLLSDVDAALKRRPNDWRALRVRAAAYFDAGRRSEAIRDLRAVLRSNPSLDDALFSVMNELLNEDRLGEATDAAREVLDARPTDAPLMFQLGKLFESRGDWEESAEMFERAWETRRSPSDGASFIDAALRLNPPDVAAANAVIEDLAGMVAGGINQSPGLLAAQALVLRARGREDFAVQQMTKAFDLSVNDEFQIQTWSQNAARFYLDLDAENEMNYYRSLRARFTDAKTRAWIDVFRAQRQLARDMQTEDALSTLRGLTEDESVLETVRVIAFRALGNHEFELENFEGAVAAWQAGLEAVPGNWELNNNAAYVLSMELGRHEDALELAERAISAGPSRSEPYDTLAEVYIKLGRFDEAEQMIQMGEQRARTYTSRVTMTITRARMAAAKGDNEDAMRLLRRARALLRTVAGRDARLESEIDKVEARIGSDG
ncbi:MAG: tetratricopeptide repeat protein, partial [Planctomycetota bacterium]